MDCMYRQTLQSTLKGCWRETTIWSAHWRRSSRPTKSATVVYIGTCRKRTEGFGLTSVNYRGNTRHCQRIDRSRCHYHHAEFSSHCSFVDALPKSGWRNQRFSARHVYSGSTSRKGGCDTALSCSRCLPAAKASLWRTHKIIPQVSQAGGGEREIFSATHATAGARTAPPCYQRQTKRETCTVKDTSLSSSGYWETKTFVPPICLTHRILISSR